MIRAKEVLLLIPDGGVTAKSGRPQRRVIFAARRVTVPESRRSRRRKFFHNTSPNSGRDYGDSYRARFVTARISTCDSKCEISWTINITAVPGLAFFHLVILPPAHPYAREEIIYFVCDARETTFIMRANLAYGGPNNPRDKFSVPPRNNVCTSLYVHTRNVFTFELWSSRKRN